MRNTITLQIGVAVCLFLSTAAFANQTIVVPLDGPSGADTQSDLRLNHETTGATRNLSENTSKKSLSSSKEAVIGQVGVITSPTSAIKRLPKRNSRNLYTCPKDTYLAITAERGQWYGVLMSDASTGWIEKGHISLLDFRVVNSSTSAQTNVTGNRIVDAAIKYLGISYKWGGYSLNGLDCSGFVKTVFANNGISLPRTAHEQALVGIPVSAEQLQPGDRLYFACKGGGIDHCGIYIGNGYFIHSSVRNRGVAVDPIRTAFFARSLQAIRRSTVTQSAHSY